MSGAPFYSQGLRFECTRCSACCRHTPGYVFLSPADLARMSAFLGVDGTEFRRSYCRQVSFGPASRVSLTEKPNLDCVFWEAGGCAVYEARPLQCRSFPFWSSQLGSRADWKECGQRCPGVGKGRLHGRAEIEHWLKLRLAEGFLES